MITDEMVEKARDGYFDAMFGRLDRRTDAKAMRSALEAVAPMIRDAVLEDAAREYEPRRKDVAIAIRALKTKETSNDA